MSGVLQLTWVTWKIQVSWDMMPCEWVYLCSRWGSY